MDALARAIDDPLGEKPHDGVLLVLQTKLAAGVRQSLAHGVYQLLLENVAFKKWTDRHGSTPRNSSMQLVINVPVPQCQKAHKPNGEATRREKGPIPKSKASSPIWLEVNRSECDQQCAR